MISFGTPTIARALESARALATHVEKVLGIDQPRYPGSNAMISETSNLTLYDRLGGVYSIAAVVDDFIDRVMHNPVLNANPAVDEAHHRVSAAGFKYYVTEMVFAGVARDANLPHSRMTADLPGCEKYAS
jgi:hypothetical protein